MEPNKARRYQLDFDRDGIVITLRPGANLPAWWDAPGWEIQQGSRIYLPIRVYDETSTAIDLSAYTARLKIRQSYAATSTLASYTSGSEITMAASEPQILIDVAGSVSATYTFTRAVFDLEIVTGTNVRNILAGFVALRKEVTWT